MRCGCFSRLDTRNSRHSFSTKCGFNRIRHEITDVYTYMYRTSTERYTIDSMRIQWGDSNFWWYKLWIYHHRSVRWVSSYRSLYHSQWFPCLYHSRDWFFYRTNIYYVLGRVVIAFTPPHIRINPDQNSMEMGGGIDNYFFIKKMIMIFKSYRLWVGCFFPQNSHILYHIHI